MIYDSTSDPAPTGYSAFVQPDSIHLFFELLAGTELVDRTVCFSIPTSNTQWPYVATQSILGGNGRKFFDARVVVGQSILSVLSSGDGGVKNVGSLYIEPAQYLSIGGIVIDSLSVVSATAGTPERFVTGDMVFLPGLNTSVSQSGNSITLVTRPGYGLGEALYTGTDNGPCDGLVESINGADATAKNQFYIKGTNGIIIHDDPLTNTIRIGLDKTNKAAKCA